MELLFLPSPPISGFDIGPLRVHFYALSILAGIVIGWWFARRRYLARGGSSEHMESIVTLAVLAGIVGARVYHVITDYQLYFGPGRNPVDALKIWNGGLGIWGGVVFGAAAVWWVCRRKGLNFSLVADSMAPGILLAQGIGRLGNWFNQELYGRPSTLPWAVEIDPQYRLPGYEQFATYHPTFLYEMLWTFVGVALIIWAERKFGLRRGAVFSLYVAFYCLGRFFIEALRIDPVNAPGGFRLNNYTSAIVFVAAVALLVWQLRHQGPVEVSPTTGPMSVPSDDGAPEDGASEDGASDDPQVDDGAQDASHEASDTDTSDDGPQDETTSQSVKP